MAAAGRKAGLFVLNKTCALLGAPIDVEAEALKLFGTYVDRLCDAGLLEFAIFFGVIRACKRLPRGWASRHLKRSRRRGDLAVGCAWCSW